jgi:hypothetical protein
MNKQALLESYV